MITLREDLLEEEKQTRKRHIRAIMAMESNPPRLPKASNSEILFFDLDFKEIGQNLHDPVVISVVAENYII